MAQPEGARWGEVRAAGYVEGLKAAGYSCAEVKAARYSAQEAGQAGFRDSSILTQEYNRYQNSYYWIWR